MTRLALPRSLIFRSRAVSGLLGAALAASVGAACSRSPAVLTQVVEARRIAAEMHIEFTKGAQAADRAVMSDTDDGSAAAAQEARRARTAVEQHAATLRALLESLGYREDLGPLDAFMSRFDEYRRLDDEILPLAVENSNLKAQRLSFGPARDAADAFRASLDRAVQSAAPAGRCNADSTMLRARAALLEIQVLQAPHIAEAEDATMTRLEGQMGAAEGVARKALDELKGALGPAAAPHLAAADSALNRFMTTHAEILTLSRRNSDVRSLALSLGRKRVVSAECEDRLRALEEAIEKHEFSATR